MFAKLTTLTPLTELKLRKTAGTSNKSGDDVLTILTPGEQLLNLSDSPVSVDGLNWYQVTVKNSGQTGFVAEAVDGNMLVGLWTAPVLSNDDNELDKLLHTFADENGIDYFLLKAFSFIESGNRYFNAENLPILRFENHVFFSYLTDAEKELYHQNFYHEGWQVHTSKWNGSTLEQFHGNQHNEFLTLQLAATINEDAAYKSASVGFCQLMLFHFPKFGFKNGKEMFEAFKTKSEQMRCFLIFLKSNPMLFQALKTGDIETVSSIYNGPANVATYSRLIREQMARLKG